MCNTYNKKCVRQNHMASSRNTFEYVCLCIYEWYCGTVATLQHTFTHHPTTSTNTHTHTYTAQSNRRPLHSSYLRMELALAIFCALFVFFRPSSALGLYTLSSESFHPILLGFLFIYTKSSGGIQIQVFVSVLQSNRAPECVQFCAN